MGKHFEGDCCFDLKLVHVAHTPYFAEWLY